MVYWTLIYISCKNKSLWISETVNISNSNSLKWCLPARQSSIFDFSSTPMQDMTYKKLLCQLFMCERSRNENPYFYLKCIIIENWLQFRRLTSLHVNSENHKFVRSGIWTHAFIEDQNTATFLYWIKEYVLDSGALDCSVILTTSYVPKYLVP